MVSSASDCVIRTIVWAAGAYYVGADFIRLYLMTHDLMRHRYLLNQTGFWFWFIYFCFWQNLFRKFWSLPIKENVIEYVRGDSCKSFKNIVENHSYIDLKLANVGRVSTVINLFYHHESFYRWQNRRQGSSVIKLDHYSSFYTCVNHKIDVTNIFNQCKLQIIHRCKNWCVGFKLTTRLQ